MAAARARGPSGTIDRGRRLARLDRRDEAVPAPRHGLHVLRLGRSSPSAWRSSETAWVSALSVTATSGQRAANSSSFDTRVEGRAARYRRRSMIFGESGTGWPSRSSRYEAASTVNGPKRIGRERRPCGDSTGGRRRAHVVKREQRPPTGSNETTSSTGQVRHHVAGASCRAAALPARRRCRSCRSSGAGLAAACLGQLRPEHAADLHDLASCSSRSVRRSRAVRSGGR
jgi:hypothetical protein